MHQANELKNLLRRVGRARKFPTNTCPASRHLHLIAETLAKRKPYAMLHDEPEHCAVSMLSVLESLWKARDDAARWRWWRKWWTDGPDDLERINKLDLSDTPTQLDAAVDKAIAADKETPNL